ncbi:MAG: polysaccharide deacetylase family protein [Verrucomicrobiota bacterium]|nr:polysaccharide deacetylase family protein [Verrucomicrobiota bacterium]
MMPIVRAVTVCLWAACAVGAQAQTPETTALAAPAIPAPTPLPQGIVVRTTENVTSGGWVWLLNQAHDAGISRIDLLVKQDEDNFQSPRTGAVLQSGELLVALPGEKTAAGWENSDWLRDLLARAKELNIKVFAWFPCFHDAQLAAAFPDASYESARHEKFVDAGSPLVQNRIDELLTKLVETYPFDGVSLDWVRWNSWSDGVSGPLGHDFIRRWDRDLKPEDLQNDYTKARWYELRANTLADWIGRTVYALRNRHPNVKWSAFLLPAEFTEASQSYPRLARCGLDYLQPMGYWPDWKKTPEWVGDSEIAPHQRGLTRGTAFWPTLGIDSPIGELERAVKNLPSDPLAGLSWFTYGTWEQKTFDKLRQVERSTSQTRALAGVSASNAISASLKTAPISPPARKSVEPKAFPDDATVWSVTCLAELYKRNALAPKGDEPVCPVLAFHIFADTPVADSPYLYRCSTAYLDALIKALGDAGFNICPISRLQSYLITGDAAMLPPKPIVITTDDGSETVWKFLRPRAAKAKFPYTIALVTSWLSEPGEIPRTSNQGGVQDATMNWAQAKELLDDQNVDVVAHSDGLHYQATEVPGSDDAFPAETIRQFLLERGRIETNEEYERRIRIDMNTNRKKLVEHGFPAPTIFCWPYGEWNQAAKAIARQMGFTHFLLFDAPATFVTHENTREDDLPRVPVMRGDEKVPVTFPTDAAEQQAWWLAFLKTGRVSMSRAMLTATLAQLTPENAARPEAEIARASVEFLRGEAAAGSARLLELRRTHPLDGGLLGAIDQTLALFAPRYGPGGK